MIVVWRRLWKRQKQLWSTEKKSLTPATDEGKLWKYSHCNVRSRDDRRTSFVEVTLGSNLIWCQTSNHSSQTTRLSESDTLNISWYYDIWHYLMNVCVINGTKLLHIEIALSRKIMQILGPAQLREYWHLVRPSPGK